MTSREYLGGLEENIMLAIQQLRGGAYGAAIHATLEEANRKISIGSLYVALGRLEDKGLVKSWMGEPTEIRGGRAKKFFELTGEGQLALADAAEVRERLVYGRRLRSGEVWA